jgi:hypothetical protein
MEDYKLRDLRVSHTLGWSWNWKWKKKKEEEEEGEEGKGSLRPAPSTPLVAFRSLTPSSSLQLGSQQKFPAFTRSAVETNSPFAHAFDRRKLHHAHPLWAPSPQYVGTKRHKHHQLSLQLPSSVLPLLPRHHCRRAPLLPGQKSPGKLHARPAP